jgi:hypothetical protein
VLSRRTVIGGGLLLNMDLKWKSRLVTSSQKFGPAQPVKPALNARADKPPTHRRRRKFR